ncbi:hypothetical protein J7F03_22005 [Streptomyces sp. ISL-43]|uniref:hypothetical protein n=1 Tax=Streptomyces sp. ISL-43 TaxID=2819183 RepID=UPI001BE6F61E|nr:hypothetical protein [Streptomyces sp. ISL-43]MBT2449705.1 hypothetical protein [Streptomyces sp. ISL-43]
MTALLKLYPAAFRREFGDEIAEAYREATHDAGRAARVREALDVTGHALRMRLGLSSARRAGQLMAVLAPFAAVAVGASAVWWMGLMVPAAQSPAMPEQLAVPYALLAATHFVMVLGAAIALSGRWAAGTWTVLTGFMATAVVDLFRLGGGLEVTAFFRTPLLLFALVALLCPADLRPQPRVRTATGLGAVALWTTLLTAVLTLGPLPDTVGGLRFAVPAAAGLALAGRQAFARLCTAPAVLLAALPFAVLGMAVWSWDVFTGPVLLGLLLAAAASVSIRRRRSGRHPVTEA